MLEFLTSLEEYRGFGWNVITISAGMIIALSFVQIWGNWMQNKRIWTSHSGKGLSVRWFAYTLCFFLSAIEYGVYTKSGAMLVNASSLAVMHIMILAGLWKFKPWTRQEKIQVTAFACMPIAMVIAPDTPVGPIETPAKDVVFLMFAFGTIAAVATQPWEMWQKKTAGVIEVRLMCIHLVSVSCWAIYGFYIDAFVLKVINPILFVLFASVILLWAKYRERDAVPA